MSGTVVVVTYSPPYTDCPKCGQDETRILAIVPVDDAKTYLAKLKKNKGLDYFNRVSTDFYDLWTPEDELS